MKKDDKEKQVEVATDDGSTDEKDDGSVKPVKKADKGKKPVKNADKRKQVDVASDQGSDAKQDDRSNTLEEPDWLKEDFKLPEHEDIFISSRNIL